MALAIFAAIFGLSEVDVDADNLRFSHRFNSDVRIQLH